MKIDILSHSTLKLTLSSHDMKENMLCCESFTAQGGNFRRVLSGLIEKESSSKNAVLAYELLEESKLLVEAFPTSEGGCMVYLSSLNRGNRSKTRKKQLLDKELPASPLIFETDSSENLGELCRCLASEKQKGMDFSSSLFTAQRLYRLALVPLNMCGNRLKRIMKEYGEVITDELAAAYTQEHFSLIAEEGAVEIGERLF